MKIITTTAEDFFRAEVDEHGWDYVDAQFARGYEPTLVNGIWVWRRRASDGLQHIFGSGTSTHSGNTASTTNRRNSVLA